MEDVAVFGNAQKWTEWLRNYEQSDPEPVLTQTARNQFVHTNTKGAIVSGPESFGYNADEVAAHVAWHRRMTDAYMQSPLAVQS